MDDKSLKKVIAKIEYEKGKIFLKNIENKPRKLFKPFMAAACILLLLGFFLIKNFSNNTTDANSLYTEYYNIYPNIVSPITRNVKAKSMQERAFFNYEAKQYQTALQTFDSLLAKKNTDKQVVNFYIANIYLETDGKTTDAIVLLKDNINASNPWQNKNLWYLALAHLKNNEPKKAIESLKELKEINSSFKKKQYLRLLDQLK